MAPAERVVSDQTVVHHDSWSEGKPFGVEEAMDKVLVEAAEREQGDISEDRHREESNNETESSEGEETRKARERQIDRIKAQIQAAARAVVASIEQDHYGGQDDSVLGTQTDESCQQEGSQVTYDEGTELTYGEGTELTYDGTETSYEPHSEHEEVAGDSSSHHDGDIDDDDVFSRNSGQSARSSLNSVHDLLSADEVQGKELTSPTVGEEAIRSSPRPAEHDTISRIPSSSSYARRDATPVTPSKVLSRPPFRTPSSVRAMQMSSPTPSIFSSPRSSKRHLPTVSRLGTPTSFSHSPSKNRTPTRFKVKKEYPLVLLHVIVLPLTWNYSHIISTPELPISLQGVKENWRLLQEKLGDTVLERGILLPHPQESYEMLEERLLEALELPVRPRARILKCGHYMGPETPTSSDEEGRGSFENGAKTEGNRRWCDICGRDVRLEGLDLAGREGEKRFRIKIYASNGLMRAGAWAACWREMESVDVEIEPFIEGELASDLEEFSTIAMATQEEVHEEQGDGFVDEEVEGEGEHDRNIETLVDPDDHTRAQQEKEMERHLIKDELRQRAQEEEDLRRKLQNEERMREVYGHRAPAREPWRHRQSNMHSSRSTLDDDSLPELLLKAFKVAMRDKRNVAICVLSVLVLLLALRPGSDVPKYAEVMMREMTPVREVVVDSAGVRSRQVVEGVAEMPVKIPKDFEEDLSVVPRANSFMTDTVEVTKPAEKTEEPEPVVEAEIDNTTPDIDTGILEGGAKDTSQSTNAPSADVPLEAAIGAV